jgi:hypothetical protein
MGNIISQEVIFYKYNVTNTTVNMYGEAAESRYYFEPVILFARIQRSEQEFLQDELLGVDFQWGIDFKFLRDDLVDINLVPEIGDIIMYNEGYYEIHTTNANRFITGKNPDYPYEPNPLNPGLENFGTSLSIICQTLYVPADKVQITKERI